MSVCVYVCVCVCVRVGRENGNVEGEWERGGRVSGRECRKYEIS